MSPPPPDGSSSCSFVVAIDGPAASGKGTLARRLAEHFGLAHLDTGRLYRATGFLVLEAGGDPSDPAAALDAVQCVAPSLLADNRLLAENVAAAGPIAVIDLEHPVLVATGIQNVTVRRQLKRIPVQPIVGLLGLIEGRAAAGGLVADLVQSCKPMRV